MANTARHKQHLNEELVQEALPRPSEHLPFGMHDEGPDADTTEEVTARPSERLPRVDAYEHYDSVEPEDIAREWLNRATEGEPISEAEEALEEDPLEHLDPALVAGGIAPISEASLESALESPEARATDDAARRRADADPNEQESQ